MIDKSRLLHQPQSLLVPLPITGLWNGKRAKRCAKGDRLPSSGVLPQPPPRPIHNNNNHHHDRENKTHRCSGEPYRRDPLPRRSTWKSHVKSASSSAVATLGMLGQMKRPLPTGSQPTEDVPKYSLTRRTKRNNSKARRPQTTRWSMEQPTNNGIRFRPRKKSTVSETI